MMFFTRIRLQIHSQQQLPPWQPICENNCRATSTSVKKSKQRARGRIWPSRVNMGTRCMTKIDTTSLQLKILNGCLSSVGSMSIERWMGRIGLSAMFNLIVKSLQLSFTRWRLFYFHVSISSICIVNMLSHKLDQQIPYTDIPLD